MSLDLLQYADGSASLILAASEAEKRPPSFFSSDRLRHLLTRPLDRDACLEQIKQHSNQNLLNDLLSDVSLCGHFVGARFDGVLPLATPPELSLPVHFVESSLPPPPWLINSSTGLPLPPPPPVQRFISVSDQSIEDPAGLRARMGARDGTGGGSLMAGADWRGFSISMPLDHQGQGKESDKKDLQEGHQDPSKWLSELDLLMSSASNTRGLPKAKAPGLQSGLLGGWLEHQHVAGPVKVTQARPPQEPKQAQDDTSINIFDQDNFWLIDAEEENDEVDIEASLEPQVTSRKMTNDQPDTNGRIDEPGGVKEEVDALLQGSEDLGLILRDKALLHQEKMQAKASRSISLAPLAGQVLPPSFRAAGQASSHEWAVRASIPDLNESWAKLKPQLAIQYPFELDIFQKEAILYMEKGQSVFVAAHTSAGKTVVAEYAFALSARHCTKAIYTSPIKTISNQKFRDFSGKFEVGLLTGDVQLKTSSPCLIMTTEILRSMLYKGADVIRDIEWVIFDEVHYVNDSERGVVWEEVIIMLPPHVSIIMLSATVPNVMDFADWVGRTKRKIIQVTGTTRRPVPLEHSLYYGGEMYLVSSKEAYVPEGMRQATLAFRRKNEVAETKKDEKASRPTGRGGGPVSGPNSAGGRGGGGAGRKGSADAARKQIQRSGYGGPGGQSSNSKPGERGQLSDLITLLTKKALLPVAFFTFSKKRCDASVEGLGGLDLTTSMEKHTIHSFVAQCLSRLREEDRMLPQIMRLRDLMKRGLAVHHAGLLPIAKEMVEMLFCQGYIKVLFCTETFAMGVNAPTRTVVFHSIRKHDGKNHRYLLPSEYTQMAGRAGRRGLDLVGTVLIACWDELPPESEIKTMMTGRGRSLESQFRLTYSMILNLLRTEDMKVEDMLKRSFAEWRAQRSMPKGQKQLEEVEKRLMRARSIPWPPCMAGCMQHEVEDYLHATLKIEDLNHRIQVKLMSHRSVQQSLVTGRVVLYSNRVNGLTELAIILGDTPSSNSSWASPEGTTAATPKVTLFGSSSSSPSLNTSTPSTSKDPPDRKLYLLALHKPGPADKKHMQQQEAATNQLTSQLPKKQQADPSDPFSGMVMKGGRGREGGGGGGAKAAPLGSNLSPGDLPRYSKIGGIDYLLLEAGSREIIGIGKSKVKIEPQDILSGDWEGPHSRKALTSTLLALSCLQEEEGGAAGPYLLDYRSDLKVADVDLVGWLTERDRWMSHRASLRPHTCSGISEQLSLVRTIDALSKARETLTHQLSDASLTQLPEFHQRVSLLQHLGYLDPESTTITLKGRALCEINSTQDELLATEMLFSGLLSDLSPSESVALLSSLVFQEKSDVEPELPPSLLAARKDLEALALRTGEEQRSQGLQIDPQEYARDALRCGMMQVVYEWAEGKPFSEIITCTDVMEGSIVRCIVRLDQACRELMDAARVLGNTDLFQKMQAASQAIKRDIVFAASLYVA